MQGLLSTGPTQSSFYAPFGIVASICIVREILMESNNKQNVVPAFFPTSFICAESWVFLAEHRIKGGALCRC